jgi:ketosteroid isomerase-like protein
MTDYDATKEAARANRAFYRAFEKLDLEAMRAVWLDDDGVKCVHPGWPLLSGIERVMGSWEAIFESTSAIAFELADLVVRIVGGLGWVTNVERMRMSEAAGERGAEALATNLFTMRDGVWRMVLHHASPIVGRPVG